MKFLLFSGIILHFLVPMVSSPGLFGQNSEKIAFVTLENQSGDPRYEYLAPIIEGILLYDLSEKGSVNLVERKNLQKIMVEQEFQQSGITDPTEAISLGKIAGATHLIYGNYTLVNGEVHLSLQLTQGETGDTWVFKERGFSEHVVHLAAEKIIRRISGRTLVLADSTNNRSLVSLRDETPGILALHSRIIGAKIFIDGEFAGFTQGDEKKPILFEHLPPGNHIVRTHLEDNFGVFQLPALKFTDWEHTVDIKPGRQTAVIDESLNFFTAVEQITSIAYDNKSVSSGRKLLLKSEKTITYTTPEGVARTLKIEFVPKAGSPDQMLGRYSLSTPGTQEIVLNTAWDYPLAGNPRDDKILKIGDLLLEASFYLSGTSYILRWEVKRTDIDSETLGR